MSPPTKTSNKCRPKQRKKVGFQQKIFNSFTVLNSLVHLIWGCVHKMFIIYLCFCYVKIQFVSGIHIHLHVILIVNEKSIQNIPKCVTNRSFHQNICKMNLNDEWYSYNRKTTRTHATTVNVQLNQCPYFWLLFCACTMISMRWRLCICYGTACEMHAQRTKCRLLNWNVYDNNVRKIPEQNNFWMFCCLKMKTQIYFGTHLIE